MNFGEHYSGHNNGILQTIDVYALTSLEMTVKIIRDLSRGDKRSANSLTHRSFGCDRNLSSLFSWLTKLKCPFFPEDCLYRVKVKKEQSSQGQRSLHKISRLPGQPHVSSERWDKLKSVSGRNCFSCSHKKVSLVKNGTVRKYFPFHLSKNYPMK